MADNRRPKSDRNVRLQREESQDRVLLTKVEEGYVANRNEYLCSPCLYFVTRNRPCKSDISGRNNLRQIREGELNGHKYKGKTCKRPLEEHRNRRPSQHRPRHHRIYGHSLRWTRQRHCWIDLHTHSCLFLLLCVIRTFPSPPRTSPLLLSALPLTSALALLSPSLPDTGRPTRLAVFK